MTPDDKNGRPQEEAAIHGSSDQAAQWVTLTSGDIRGAIGGGGPGGR